MAECGPSNALTQFKQQTSHDRTLQQDRLASRRNGPAQGFRSADPRAGLLDPEFEAFQAGLAPADLPQYQQQFNPQMGFAQPPQQQQQPAWAADFQRMQISPQPFAQQHNLQHAQADPAAAQWAQGFREHIAQNAPRAQQSSASPQAFQQRARFGLTGFQSSFAQQPAFAPTPQMQSKGKEPVVDDFDAAAFERAFDQAREDLMGEEEQSTVENQKLNEQNDTMEAEITKGIHKQDPGFARHEIINDILQEPPVDLMDTQTTLENTQLVEEETQDQKQGEDDDALAATAQELLEKIEHNQTDKFKNSQFLSLMRKLRDREMKVEGDKMVETVSASYYDQVIAHSPSPPPDSAYGTGVTTPSSSTLPPTAESGGGPAPPQKFLRPLHHDIENTEFDHWESPYN